MRKVFEYSHLGGAEILKLRFPQINHEIDSAIHAVAIGSKNKVSREKTKRGRLLYAPKEINRKLEVEFRKYGFKELRDTYDIEIRGSGLPPVRGVFKQIDFAKGRVLVEAQFGKYAFMFYDMAKFQYFFNEMKADVGVEIVPWHGLSRQMSSGVSYGEQLISDIERLRRHFPAVPVKIILVDVA